MSFIQFSALFDHLITKTREGEIQWRRREALMFETVGHKPFIVIMRSFDRSQICIAMQPFRSLGINGRPKFFQQGTFFWTDAQRLFVLIEQKVIAS